jgi:hypothetical protein
MASSTLAVDELVRAKRNKTTRETISMMIDAKLILQDARRAVSRGRPSRHDSRQALKDAHHSVELVMRRKAEELGTKPYDFDSIVKVLKRRGVIIPYEREMEELNKSRVLVQHYGTVLDGKDVYRLVVASENFMKDFLSAAFHIDYDSLSELETLGNNDIKETIKKAQKALAANDFEDAAINAHLAIQKTKWIIDRKLSSTGRGYSMRHFSFGLGSLGSREVSNAINELSEEIQDTRDIVISGPFAQDIRRLGEITRAAFLPIIDGPVKIQVMNDLRESEPRLEDATFAVQLAIEYSMWIDQVFGIPDDTSGENKQQLEAV